MNSRTIGVCVLIISSTVMPSSMAESLLDRSKKDELVFMGDDDPAMVAAFKRARDGLDKFLIMAKDPPAHFRTISVKVAISDKGRTEYFWIVPFRQSPEGYLGVINNRPQIVGSVKMGQEISFGKKDIVDWMYVDSTKKRIFGNFTGCALLTKESPGEAEELKRKMGMECDA